MIPSDIKDDEAPPRKLGEPPLIARLRSRAEALVSRTAVQHTRRKTEEDVRRVQHELEVHQVELRLQNDELLRAQDELAASRDRYRELFDLAPVGYLALDASSRIADANLAAATLLGVERDALVGVPLASFLGQADADALHLHLRDALDAGARRRCDVRVKPRGAAGAGCPASVPVHIESTALTAATAPATCLSVLIDMSDVQRAEAGRRTWQARGETILDTMADAVVTSDTRGTIEAFNPAAQRLFGYSTAQLVGRNVSVLMPEPYRSEHDGYIDRYTRTGVARMIGQASREMTARHRDGTTFPIDLSIACWMEDGRRKFTAIIRDLTARERSEHELRDSEARFRQIAEHLVDGVMVWQDSPPRVEYLNAAFDRIFGEDIAILRANPHAWLNWIGTEDRARLGQALEHYASGESFDEEYSIALPSRAQHRLRVRMRVFAIPDETDTSRQRHVTLVQDVTAERELEEELRQAQKMEAVGALASGVAHDFNNILQAVLGCLSMAGRADISEARAQSYLDRAAGAVRRGGELAGRMMEFSHKQRARPRRIAIDPLIRRSAELVDRLVTEAITVEVATDAPGQGVVADPVQIEQILLNLAANARDAMPAGGRLSIRTDTLVPSDGSAPRVGLDRTKHYVRLVVEDSGTGMDEATRRKIFEPFFTTKRVGKGTGLGLSTVFALARQLGGCIDVDSALGRGTRFSLWLPAYAADNAVMESEAAPMRRFAGTALLVEDEALVRMAVRHYLEELGWDVLAAAGVEEATQLCEVHTGPIDLLVSDIVLPVMRGPELAKLIRARYPAIRVLLMSANPELAAHGNDEDDAAPVLAKPFGVEGLSEALHALLDTQFGRTPDVPDVVAKPVATRPHIVNTERQSIASERTPAAAARILLVEDESSSREAIADFLTESGYAVVAAATTDEALCRAAEHESPFDLLLTDLGLPGIGGEALAARLRTKHRGLRVVCMSGAVEAPPGGAPFVHKPIDLDQLLAVIEQTLA